MKLSILDTVIFFSYFVGIVVFALTVAARSKTKSSADFFLASKKLPWYAVGASFIASNISTEHFIGMVGWGFLYGMAVANWEWANVITFTILIFIFLPFYRRGGVATMPEFLERRFNKPCRYIYAVVMIIGLVIAMLGGVLFAGAKALNVFFPQISTHMGILILAGAAGTYTIYGGLLSAVWADLVQYILLMTAGVIVLIFGLHHVGGFQQLFDSLPEKFIVFYPPQHEMIPWTGWAFGVVSVGIWYNCANQFMVQRCLGARSEWDARMGVVMAGFSKALLPLIVVVPGIIAFYLFHNFVSDGDQAWPFLVKQFLPAGLIGLVLAGLASAILSTLSAITTSSATIFSLDLYRAILRPDASDRQLHLVARISGAVVMLIGVLVAIIIASLPGLTVFGIIQTVFFYVAPPIAAIFLIGILWPRATSAAATATLIVGFCVFLPLTVYVIFDKVPFLAPYNNFMHHTSLVFALSGIFFVIVSLFTKPKPRAELVGVIWTPAALRVSPEERAKNRGWRSLTLWWALMVVSILSLYIFTNSRGSRTKGYEAENLEYTVSAGSTRIQKRSELLTDMTSHYNDQLKQLEQQIADATSLQSLPPDGQQLIDLRQQLTYLKQHQPKFNLWTGAPGQRLFEPTADQDQLTLTVPVKKPGRYRLDAIVTTGPDYGKFRALVQGQPADIAYPVTTTKNDDGRPFAVDYPHTQVFDAYRPIGPDPHAPDIEGIAGSHVVQRISLAHDLALSAETFPLTLIAVDPNPEHPLIGIDQIFLTYIGPLE